MKHNILTLVAIAAIFISCKKENTESLKSTPTPGGIILREGAYPPDGDTVWLKDKDHDTTIYFGFIAFADNGSADGNANEDSYFMLASSNPEFTDTLAWFSNWGPNSSYGPRSAPGHTRDISGAIILDDANVQAGPIYWKIWYPFENKYSVTNHYWFQMR